MEDYFRKYKDSGESDQKLSKEWRGKKIQTNMVMLV